MRRLILLLLMSVCCGALPMAAQEYSVQAVDVNSGKPLKGIPITVRYDCASVGTVWNMKTRCRFIERKTGADGIAHFPEAGSLHAIDDIYSIPKMYEAYCCDIEKPVIPGTATISFRRKSPGEMLERLFGIE